jgi:hypothetical protein
MHIISFMFRTNPQVMQFHYDTKDHAERQYDKTKNWNPGSLAVEVEDDYGSTAVIRLEDISGVFMTDFSKEMVAHQKVLSNKMKAEFMAQREAQGSIGQMVVPVSQGPKLVS